ncbi:MAG: hypothetical protein EA407_02875 [Rhodobacteraceae bacterium]|nr:MAG: hypothetical protein EA407_02875 [Paracoccaceae bacterium]
MVANAVGGSTATGQRTTLDIRDAAAGNDGIETLTLSVSNGVRMELRNSAENIENLIITGTGPLVLSGQNNFPNLVTLNTTGNTFTGDLTLDVSGSAVLESVLTGVGNDFITVSAAAASSGDLSVNLGAGTDILGVDGVEGEGDIAGLDFTGGVTNVENLAFTSGVDLDDAATLDLDGFDDTLEAVWFFEGLTGGENFSLANAPEVLAINATNPLEADPDADREFVVDVLDTGAIEDLTITTDGELSINNMNAPSLASLALVQSGLDADGDGLGEIDLKITSDEDHDVSNLEAISAQADGGATVTLDASDADDADMDALESVSVSGENATLTMNGVAPEQQVQSFTIVGPFVGVATIAFNVPGAGVVSGTGNSPATITTSLNAALEANDAGYEAELVGANTIQFTKIDAGPEVPITFNSTVSVGLGSLTITDIGVTTDGVDSAGFEALEDVVVDAEANAEVNLSNVQGDFTVDVTAADNANVMLDNTSATEVTVVADTSMLMIGGELFGNPALETLSISGSTTTVTMSDDLSKLSSLDLSGVTETITVDVGEADYGVRTQTDAVEYLISSAETVEFTAESEGQAREVFKFVGNDIGDVTIDNFDNGGFLAAERDILDFSAFTNITSAVDLEFVDDGSGNIQINAAGDQFSGSIVLEGVAFNVDNVQDLALYSIQYV